MPVGTSERSFLSGVFLRLKIMDLFSILSISIFFLGYSLIALEEKLNTNKSAIALAMAGILWLIAALSRPAEGILEGYVHEASAEVFEIVIFLLRLS